MPRKRWNSITIDLPREGYYLVRTPQKNNKYIYYLFALKDDQLICFSSKKPKLCEETSEWCECAKL